MLFCESTVFNHIESTSDARSEQRYKNENPQKRSAKLHLLRLRN
jgi:hypothetical protein